MHRLRLGWHSQKGRCSTCILTVSSTNFRVEFSLLLPALITFYRSPEKVNKNRDRHRGFCWNQVKPNIKWNSLKRNYTYEELEYLEEFFDLKLVAGENLNPKILDLFLGATLPDCALAVLGDSLPCDSMRNEWFSSRLVETEAPFWQTSGDFQDPKILWRIRGQVSSRIDFL